jgi:hypothetical protein
LPKSIFLLQIERIEERREEEKEGFQIQSGQTFV